jgi:hypothetical protein
VRFEASIDAFSAALVAPEAAPPTQTRGRQGRPDAKRFSVYRNNVAVGLIGALEARFPVTLRLVGAEFFRAMARAYIAVEKPRDALIIHYGASFPDFIEAFEPARALAYLPDVARLESAWVESYHAAEALALTLAALAEFPAERLADARVGSHPSTRLLRSQYPAASIWAAHQGEGEPQPPARWIAEDILITRPDADVFTRVLPAGGYDFARMLLSGETIAVAAANVEAEGFDPGAHLVGLIEAGAIVAILL